jgi:hypothetical protein
VIEDVRKVLRDAGVECSEAERYAGVSAIQWLADAGTKSIADEAVDALAHLVVKYKWQRDWKVWDAKEMEEAFFRNGARASEADVTAELSALDAVWEKHLDD